VSSKLDVVVMVHNLGERLGVGFLANMPGGDPAEHGGRYAWAGFCHAGNSKVDAVSEDCA
jgi:hypothetical protein